MQHDRARGTDRRAAVSSARRDAVDHAMLLVRKARAMPGPTTTNESRNALEETVPAEGPAAASRVANNPLEPLSRGATVGRYTVLERIGAGGMGVVYAAFDPELDRRVALKVLHGGNADGMSSSGGRSRLLREAQAMAKLHHPNVITVHDVGTFGDRVFVAMEFVDGTTLREWVTQGVHDWAEIVEVFVKAGRGLAAAHAIGLVHRDFKPDNVLVGHDGRVLVMDFGLARQAGASVPVADLAVPPRTGATPVDLSLTRTGALLGTPAYMAPEQHTGGVIGPAVDQFGYCVALYEALWGSRPFVGNSVASLALAVLEGKPTPPPRDSDVPGWLFGVIAHGLAVEPSDRHPSMDALLAELQRDPPRSHRPWLAAVVAIAVAMGIVGTYLATRPDPAELCASELAALPALIEPDTEARIVAQFEASGREHASTTWASARARVDAWDERWRGSWAAACVAERGPPLEREHAAGPSTRCLDTQRELATRLLAQLEAADGGMVDASLTATLALDDPRECAGPYELRSTAVERARTDQRAAAVETRVLTMLQRWSEAAARIGGFANAPGSFDDRAIEAELFRLAGVTDLHEGRTSLGRARLRRAVVAAASAKHGRLELQAWVDLLESLPDTITSSDEAFSTIAAAESAILAVGDDADMRRRWWTAQGHLELALGRPREAMDRYDHAIIVSGAEPLYAARLQQHRCAALVALELPSDGYDACNEAQRELATLLGDTHPWVGLALTDLAAAQMALEQHGPAVASLLRAIDVFDPAGLARARTIVADGTAPQWRGELPPHPEPLARALNRVGVSERAQRRFAAAASAHATAAALLSTVHPSGSRALGYPLLNLGITLLDLRRPQHALPHLRRALSLWEDTLADDHPDLALAHLALANALGEVGEWSQAGEHYQIALQAWEGQLSPDHPLLAYALTGLAHARIELDDASAAIDPLERALELRRHEREDAMNVAETSWWLARALFVSGADESRALELAGAALFAAGVEGNVDPLELRRWLAGGETPGITDRFVPAALGVIDRTQLR
ncbi:MAG: protein kinase [Deltaproteobacteria bacterium]|nr:protein kinase [Deltaproteobacteria bacterium]